MFYRLCCDFPCSRDAEDRLMQRKYLYFNKSMRASVHLPLESVMRNSVCQFISLRSCVHYIEWRRERCRGETLLLRCIRKKFACSFEVLYAKNFPNYFPTAFANNNSNSYLCLTCIQAKSKPSTILLCLLLPTTSTFSRMQIFLKC